MSLPPLPLSAKPEARDPSALPPAPSRESPKRNQEPSIHDEHCIICLDPVSEICQANPCGHTSFDYLCLLTWVQIRTVCPLCKKDIRRLRYRSAEDGRWKTHYVFKLQHERTGSGRNDEVRRRGASATWPVEVDIIDWDLVE